MTPAQIGMLAGAGAAALGAILLKVATSPKTEGGAENARRVEEVFGVSLIVGGVGLALASGVKSLAQSSNPKPQPRRALPQHYDDVEEEDYYENDVEEEEEDEEYEFLASEVSHKKKSPQITKSKIAHKSKRSAHKPKPVVAAKRRSKFAGAR